MSNDEDKMTEQEFDEFVRTFDTPMPEKAKENVLEEIRRKQMEQAFEQSDEDKNSAPESPDLEL